MNFIGVIILSTILSELVLSLVADYLNLTALNKELPDEFEDVYDADQYEKSQEYLKVNTKFGWITGVINTIILLIFWFGEGFSHLDNWLVALNQGPIITGMLYIGILLFVIGILSIPFSIYSTFVIEERFGFNKTTWSVFIKDKMKGILLAVILGGPLLAGILAFFIYAGPHAWWSCWGGVTVYMIGVQYIAPSWIMPLFNKFTPLNDGELKDTILTYAESIHFPLKNVFVMDGSKRSNKANAFFTGFGKNKRIVLFDTLIEQHSVPELLVILAHEMGHYKKKHIRSMLLLGILQNGVIFYLLSLFISYDALFDAFYMDRVSIHTGLIFFGMLYSPLGFFLGIFLQIMSRKNEYQADRFAVQTTQKGHYFMQALKKLVVNNLSNLTPHPFYVFLNYSHPPILNRIRKIKTFSSSPN